MNDNEPVTSVNKSEKTIVDNRERADVAPHFDAVAVERARPAVPISKVYSGRNWWLTLIVAAALAGLAGGVIGSVLTSNFLRRDAPPHEPSYVRVEESVREDAAPAVEAAPEKAEAPEQEIIEAAEGQPAAGDDAARRGAAAKDEEAALRAALEEWVAATNARDLGRQMTFYGPTVHAFYRARNATPDLVRADKARAFRNADSINVRVGDPQIDVGPDGRSATMRFRKSYSISGGGEDRSGEVVQELRWRLVDGKWRIISERDLKVLR